MASQNIRLMELDLPHERVPPPIPPVAHTRAWIERQLDAIARDRERVFAVIEQMRDDIVRCLQELVRIPSVNPSPEGEKPLADHVAGLMRELGMEVQQLEPAPTRVSNLGRLPGSRGDRSLLFYAHLDTVPPGDESEWQYPPFEAHLADGKVWGRGAKDCKLGMAAALMAVRALHEAGVRLSGDLQIVTPCDEERGGNWGLAQMVQRGMIKADWAIYGEGVPDRVTIGHRGHLDLHITTKGKTAHTAWKHHGQNAVLQMCALAPVIDALEYQCWQPHPIVPGGVVGSVNIIHGGFKENVVPDRCTITVDVRFPPGVTAQAIIEEIQQTIARARHVHPHIGEVMVEPQRYSRPSFIQPDEPITLFMQRAVEEVLGQAPQAEGMLATSDSRWLVLDAGIPTVNFSMGNDSGHRPNEWAGIQDLIDNTKIYALMALLLLSQELSEQAIQA